MKKIITLLLQTTLIIALAACSTATAETTASDSAAQLSPESEAVNVGTDTGAVVASSSLAVKYDSEDLNPNTNTADVSYVKLEGDTISYEGENVGVDGNVLTITSAGVYDISGTLNDGQILVDSQYEGTVTLILNGANITSSNSAPIFVRNAEKIIITLADGTQNVVTDGASYVFDSVDLDEPNAAIFSKDDLTINGNGSLTVNANFNNGIASKDNLKITGGVITVNAVNDGIKGKNYIAVNNGTITVNAGADGLQSNNDEDAEKGFVLIEGGTLNITSVMDGIQAETSLTINGGTVSIATGGGSTQSYDSDVSAKGLKANVDITIAGGVVNIDSFDDAINSNVSVTINGGDTLISSGDDGIHANSAITFNGGSVNITKSYEGIESTTITVNDGNIHVATTDDGLNAAGGVDGSSTNGRPGQNGFEAATDAYIYINGGYLYVNSGGDGIDSNGSIEMTAGTAIVSGPTNNSNGSLDYNGTFNITGGYLLAVGSSGMVQAPSETSTIYSVKYGFESMQAAGTLVHIETESSEEILTFVASKEYQSVLLASPTLANGSSYVVYTGGTSTGTAVDGLYSGGTYSAGTQVANFTISSIVTSAGVSGGMMGGPGGGGGPRP